MDNELLAPSLHFSHKSDIGPAQLLKKFDKSKNNAQIIREKYNIKQDDFVMAIVARIKNLRNKGHQDLLEMMNKYTKAMKLFLFLKDKGENLNHAMHTAASNFNITDKDFHD